MKFFQRTLLSFAGVIALQAALTGAALAAIFGSMQAEDAQREVSAEAANAYESFNAWKLAFWKEINDLVEDPALEAAVSSASAAGGSPLRSASVERALARRLSATAAQAVVLRDNAEGSSRYLGTAEPGREFPDPASFYCAKAHPYVEIIQARGGLWFVGTARIAPAARRPLDAFILKRIDADLLGHLSYDPMVAVAITVPGGGQRIAGMYSGGAGSVSGAAAATLAFARREPALSRFSGEAYAYLPKVSGGGGPYSAVLRLTGTVASAGGEKPVLLGAVLSLAEYGARAERLARSVLSVSLVVAALTIVLAMIISGSIVGPVRRLLRAMRRIEGGDYRAELRGPVSGEIGELLEGFNGMARKLEADKLEMEEYIAEIVGLKERADGIIESIREGLAVIDSEGGVESANGSFRRLFGESAGRAGARLAGIDRGPFDEALVEEARDAMRDRESRGGITRRAADGRSFEIKLYPLVAATGLERARCIVIVEDVSERLENEERVIQADRLASMGMLSAGVAHEINNPLSSILANVGNAISESGDPEVVATLRVVEGETHRIARIVRQLLDFSAPRRAPRRSRAAAPGRQVAASDEPPPRCDANEVARELVRLVGFPLRAEGRIEFALDLDPGCPEAAMGEDELKQVLLNLLKNAVQAVGGSGRVEVATRAEEGALRLSVSDDGPPIPEEDLGRIFDPFFTTKSAASSGPAAPGGTEAGLGLGLSVAYGIVAKRGGSIRAANEEGGGAIFTVVLPAAGGERR
jgi:signal transduction histidine kinase/HAMP domain-containing protein